MKKWLKRFSLALFILFLGLSIIPYFIPLSPKVPEVVDAPFKLQSAYGQVPTKEELEGYVTPLLQKKTAAALIDFLRTAKSEPLTKLKGLELPLLGIC